MEIEISCVSRCDEHNGYSVEWGLGEDLPQCSIVIQAKSDDEVKQQVLDLICSFGLTDPDAIHFNWVPNDQ